MFDKTINKFGVLNSYDIYKFIAFIAMIVDHLGYYFFPDLTILRVIGRVAIIIFAVLYGFSSGKKNNGILLYAFLTLFFVQFIIERDFLPINILFNFYISHYLINWLENFYNEDCVSFFLLVIVLFFLSFFIGIFPHKNQAILITNLL